MFGESDSESPRAPSPWDSLTSSPSPPVRIPKLVPEVEEGNVEYKLQLLSPTPARFARLVTQLKWRLLEGGGQAYYELGVADSGMLIGLHPQQLEESLGTLEMMAGEIGASVTIVKEIEVSPALSNLAESQLERWNGRRSTRRKDTLRIMKQHESPTSSADEPETEPSSIDLLHAKEYICHSPSSLIGDYTRSGPSSPSISFDKALTVFTMDVEESIADSTEFETELSNADLTGAEEGACLSPITPPALSDDYTRSRPSSPSHPFDPALAMFTMGIEENVADYVDYGALHEDTTSNSVVEIPFSLVISSVYKPRPMKKRATQIAPPPLLHFEYTKKKPKNGHPSSRPAGDSCHHTRDSVTKGPFQSLSPSKEAKAQFRRDKRDKRRELRHNTSLTIEPLTSCADHYNVPLRSAGEHDSFLPQLLHAAIVNPPNDEVGVTTIASKEPRLIVEVLVVRKLSLDEAFLDFEGFSLH